MAGWFLRHRGSVATAVAAVALALVGTARWAPGDVTFDLRPWAMIAVCGYAVVAAGLFAYLGAERAREALDATDSSLAEAQVVVALSPTVVAAVLHLAGADVWAVWLALGITLVELLAWSGLLARRSRTSGE